MGNEDNERCCGNCISFTNEDAFGEGLCCEDEGGTVCWGYCNKHKFKHRKVNMKDEYIEQIAKELTEYMEWMRDSTSKEVTDAALDELIEESGDIYEVVVDIHLNNSDVVTLRNECLLSFDEKRYLGANVELDLNNGNIIADISIYIPFYRSIKIPLTSICWIDSHTEAVNWKKYKCRKKIERIIGTCFKNYKQ